MFTNNYIKFKEARFRNKSVSVTACDGSSFTHSPFRIDTPDIGAIMQYGRCMSPIAPRKDPYSSSQFDSSYSYSISALCPGMYFGTGNTPASKTDYKLESTITSGLTIANAGVTSRQESDGKYTEMTLFVLTNTSEAELNIYEIGLFGMCAYSTNSSYTHYGASVLFERTVLDEPVTIAPGETKLVTYKITFNQF